MALSKLKFSGDPFRKRKDSGRRQVTRSQVKISMRSEAILYLKDVFKRSINACRCIFVIKG